MPKKNTYIFITIYDNNYKYISVCKCETLLSITDITVTVHNNKYSKNPNISMIFFSQVSRCYLKIVKFKWCMDTINNTNVRCKNKANTRMPFNQRQSTCKQDTQTYFFLL